MHTNHIVSKSHASRRSIRIAFALGLVGVAPLAYPQAQDAEVEEDQIFELSPFTVEGAENEGYRATSTLAGTRIRTDLKDVGSAISVYTDEFLSDLGATDGGSLMQYTTNAEVAGTRGTYTGVDTSGAVDDSGALRNPVSSTRIRGLAGADNTRDYFGTDIPWDTYAVNRIDVQRGANSMLFGLGSPAGIVNATFADAGFEDEGQAQIRFGSYGSMRTSVNFNKVLIEDRLAIRVAALHDAEKFKQDPAFEDDDRIYAAVRWEPKLGSDSMKTAFRAKYENGSIDANRPRTTTPLDSVTAWFSPLGYNDSTNPNGGLGKYAPENNYDAWTNVQQATDAQVRRDHSWVGTIVGQQTAFLTFDGATGQMYDAKMGVVNKGAIGPNGETLGTSAAISGRNYSEQLLGLSSLSEAAKNGGYNFADYGLYRSQSLQDPTVFDFYNNLIDGPNKSEWGGWEAYNLDLSQTFLDNRIGANLTYDKQDYNRGGDGFLGWGPTINVDITKTFQDGQANPNFGRPFIASSGGGGSEYVSSRTNKRASLFGELRATDAFETDSFLAKLLGKHVFNAVSTEEDYQYENTGWSMKAADQAWQGYWNNNDGSGTTFNDRAPVAVVYLGDSLASRSSASGANIPGIGSVIDWRDTPIQTFESIWNPPAGVAWDDPWSGPAVGDPSYATTPPVEEDGWQQRSNPANYTGWTYNNTLGVRSYDDGADPGLRTSANMTQREISSLATTWQSHWWNDSLITTFGWRKDEVQSRSAVAKQLTSIKILDTSPENYYLPDYTPGDTYEAETTSGGAVLHLNKILGEDPLPINVSLSYNKSSNFQVGQVRRDVYGESISNPSGDTEDYGVTLSTKDGKYSFRAIKYESNANNASANIGNVGNLGSTISNGLTWRNVFLYKLAAYDYNGRETTDGRAWLSTAYPETGDNKYKVERGTLGEQQLEDQMINTWNDIQAHLTEKGFFEAWNFDPIPLQYLTDRSTYAATLDANNNAAAQYTPPAGASMSYGASTPPNFAVTADVISKGYEFELTANPIDNLRLSFNASKSEVINSNVGGANLTEFVEYIDGKIKGTIAGDMPRWGNPGGSMYSSIWSSFIGSYKLMKLQEGTAVPELRKWRYTAVGNYTFSDGKLKGLGIGGSYRWQDKVAIGYPMIPINSTDYTFDIANPVFGPSEDFVDLWASYDLKLSETIDWRIQLNVRNVGAGNKLIPITIQPDAALSTAGARIAPSQEWFITNTFSF